MITSPHGSKKIIPIKTNSYINIALCTALLFGSAAHAADYPVKPVRVIAGFPAGSAVDIVARTVGQKLSEAYAQPAVIDSGATRQDRPHTHTISESGLPSYEAVT